MCARIAVMYLGRIVELGETAAVFEQPRHPYTRSLLAAVPRIGGRRVTLDFALQGEPPNPRDVPSGCRFRDAVPALVQDVCAAEEPTLARCRGPPGGLPLRLMVMHGPAELVLALLIAVAALVTIARRLEIAYPIFLVIGGPVLGLVPGCPGSRSIPI